jgi:predicted glycoside hydrolase/deacetylase ChbG (UPF0249 family)
MPCQTCMQAVCVCVFLWGALSGETILKAQSPTLAERLDQPKDTKLLILHADDIGMAHSIDRASFEALQNHDVSSASAMVPCPWFVEVVEFAKKHPDADIGLHLALNSEWMTYRWGPVAPREAVMSLLDPQGYFYYQTPGTLEKGLAAEAEKVIRAQVEFSLRLGLHPTHLDAHENTLYERPDFFQALLKVAQEYHVPIRAPPAGVRDHRFAVPLSPQEFKLESLLLLPDGATPDHWKEKYLRLLDEVKPGLNEMIVHLGYDDLEVEAMTAGYNHHDATWRQRDFDAVRSAEFKEALRRNHIVLTSWREVARVQ